MTLLNNERDIRMRFPSEHPWQRRGYGIAQDFSPPQNYPNPFNPTTEINYGLAENTHVTLRIYNIKGQLVKTLVDEDKSSGYYKTYWDGVDESGKEVASSIYFYRIQAGDFSLTRKMVLLK